MVECPKCNKIVDYQRYCSKCGAIIIETAEDRFNAAADLMLGALQTELQTRKRKRRMKYTMIGVSVAVVLAAAGIVYTFFVKHKLM
ncbi:hypothetical protein [Paenibacillus aestuarii]|uniref:Zinc ribbon domain-containing protein n=1 Tax=Paenibacillus aestuarii TaxID=516965 RepID=A0ABW0KHZ8_9BACL|nr:hypothetical protein [Paenibacillus aestuarii]